MEVERFRVADAGGREGDRLARAGKQLDVDVEVVQDKGVGTGASVGQGDDQVGVVGGLDSGRIEAVVGQPNRGLVWHVDQSPRRRVLGARGRGGGGCGRRKRGTGRRAPLKCRALSEGDGPEGAREQDGGYERATHGDPFGGRSNGVWPVRPIRGNAKLDRCHGRACFFLTPT